MTDADLVLGYLDPDFFLGGRMKLDKAAAEQAIMAKVGSQLDLELTRVSWGIHETVNENVAQAFRLHASEHGRDYRQFAMVGFGGSGPVHALRIARILRIPQVILPVGAGVMSAFGLLMSPLSFETVRSSLVSVPQLNDKALSAQFRPLIEEASAFLHRAGVAPKDVTIRRRVDMRYKGQGYEIEVMLPDSEGRPTSILELPNLFAREYERIFSHSFVDGTLEITNFKVEAVGPAPSMEGGYSLGDAPAGAKALKGKRQAYFPEAGGYVDAPVYDRYALQVGERVEGPAMIEERESTCVVGVGDAVTVDEHHNLIAEVAAGRSA
jgi:N-methylhydantoinase A